MSARSPRLTGSSRVLDGGETAPSGGTEQGRSEIEDRYRAIVETASEGIWTIDTEHRTTFANRALAGDARADQRRTFVVRDRLVDRIKDAFHETHAALLVELTQGTAGQSNSRSSRSEAPTGKASDGR